jgi:DNA-binding GntR family transcriptional regulator
VVCPDNVAWAWHDVPVTAPGAAVSGGGASPHRESPTAGSPAPVARSLSSQELLDLLDLDRNSPVPLYFQIAQHLEQAIESGALPPGTRLDNEVQLAASLGLSRPTMRQAMQYLVDKGMIVRRRGIGTRVVQPKVRRPLELTSLYDDLRRAGQSPSTRVLQLSVGPADPDVARALALPDGGEVVSLVRLRSAADRPIARLTNHLPVGLLDVTAEDMERCGLYQLMRTAGVQLHSATQVIGARTATREEAELLDEDAGSALLTMERVAYDDHGAAVEFGRHVYVASRYSFELNLRTN